MKRVDLLIAGGGLAGSLLALAMRARKPELRVVLIEADDRIGGNHIWSFFDSDMAPEDRALVEPLICHSWDSYEVAFPRYRRTIATRYHSIESERLDAVVRAAMPPEDIITGRAIRTVDRGGVAFEDGERLDAGAVIEARGLRDTVGMEVGWQKFVGQTLRLDRPHGLDRPTIMDATVDQAEGYRFVYLLPFGPNEIFVEDTYYSTEPDLDLPRVRERIADYAIARGWRVRGIMREESAALPIALEGDIAARWRDSASGVGKIGMAAGLFQPMTGYSLPDAVRTVRLVTDLPTLERKPLYWALHDHSVKTWRERGFYRLLSRLLFRGSAPPGRYRMLQRFYGLKPALIGRFYAGRSTRLDKLRILCGKPPVPFFRAARIVLKGSK